MPVEMKAYRDGPNALKYPVTCFRKIDTGNGSKIVPTSYIGMYTDEKGKTWRCYVSRVLDLSVWVRLEPAANNSSKRPRFVYDPGCGFRKGNKLKY